MKSSEKLAIAKHYLWLPNTGAEAHHGQHRPLGGGRNATICASLLDGVGLVESADLRNEIMHRLGEYATVTEWLCSQGFVSSHSIGGCTPAEAVQIQQFRLLWLEHLQAEYAAKGD
jgi:hypothetical protein